MAHLVFSWVRVLVQQDFGRHEDARSAVAALERGIVNECLLQWIKRASYWILQPFNGGYLLPGASNNQNKAGQRGFAVDLNGTGAAFTDSTCIFGPGQFQLWRRTFSSKSLDAAPPGRRRCQRVAR